MSWLRRLRARLAEARLARHQRWLDRQVTRSGEQELR